MKTTNYGVEVKTWLFKGEDKRWNTSVDTVNVLNLAKLYVSKLERFTQSIKSEGVNFEGYSLTRFLG